MFFWLKKAVAYWMMPLPVCLALMLVGLMLLGNPSRRRLGQRLLAAGLLLLLTFSHERVSYWLLRPLESQYAALPDFTAGTAPPALARCRYVVVLGGGHSDIDDLSANNKLSSSALSRLIEGVRLLRVLPGARLVVSGPGAAGRPSHADVLAQVAVSLGIEPGRILRIDTARDTGDEALAVRQLAAGAPVALVTSAWHEPRAVALFRKAGVDVLPCPADFLAKTGPGFHWSDLLFDVESLERSTRAIHERLGYLWVWLQGKT